MKKLITYLTLLILLFSTPSFAKHWIMPAYDGLTGGTAGKLDSIDVCSADGAGYDVQDKDAALVWDQTAGTFSLYIFDIDSAAAESDPSIIAPDYCNAVPYTGDGRWLLSYPAMTATGADAIAGAMTGPGTNFNQLSELADDINAQKRLTQSITAVTFGAGDATPDVTNGGTSVVQFWETVDTTTITDFDDGDNHSEFVNGDAFIILCQTAQVFDLSDNVNLKGHGNNDYTCAAGEFILVIHDDTNDYWVLKPSETKTSNFTSFILPNGTDPDVDAAGETGWDSDDFWMRFYDGSAQRAIPTEYPIYFSVAEPDTMDARDYMPIFTNNTGASITIISMYCLADDDDVDFRIEEYDADGSSNEALVKAETCDTGAGPYTNDGQTTITAATVEDGHILVLDFDDTDTPDYLHCTLWYTVNANVD